MMEFFFFFFYVNVFFLRKIIYFLYTKINFSYTPIWSIVNRRLIYRMKNSKWLLDYIFLWFFESYRIHHYALFILFLLLFYIFINIDIINNININCAFFFYYILFILFVYSNWFLLTHLIKWNMSDNDEWLQNICVNSSYK